MPTPPKAHLPSRTRTPGSAGQSEVIIEATEASTRGLMVSVLYDGRYTSNSSSDLRPDALDAFLKRCIASARYLEPDPDRAQPDGALCGRGVSEEQLEEHFGRRRVWLMPNELDGITMMFPSEY